MYFRGSGLSWVYGFAPASITDVYICPRNVISTCPDHFHDWRITTQCTSGRIEYVYASWDEKFAFRNPACAVCNDVVDYRLHSQEISSSEAAIRSFFNQLYQASDGHQFGIRLEGASAYCCRSCPDKDTVCSRLNLTNWGSILNPITNQCQAVPFSTECDGTPSIDLGILRRQDLCPEFDTMCPGDIAPPETTTYWYTSTILGEPTSTMLPFSTTFEWKSFPETESTLAPRVPDPFEVVFHPDIHISSTEIIKTELIGDNSTYILCNNRSIRNPETGIDYKTLQLHQGIIKVCH